MSRAQRLDRDVLDALDSKDSSTDPSQKNSKQRVTLRDSTERDPFDRSLGGSELHESSIEHSEIAVPSAPQKAAEEKEISTEQAENTPPSGSFFILCSFNYYLC